MMREARAAAAFTHPNVVAIHDVGEVDGAPYITMELVSGRSLREFVTSEKPGLTERLGWLKSIAHGLAAAHRAELVHRDIKPDNVMVTPEGAVKILDFGIARRSEQETPIDSDAPTATARLASLTGEGVMVGTPQYMAPEQLQALPLDGRADQFAWGVLAWELLTGATPWGAHKNGAQLIAAVLSMPLVPLRNLVPALPAHVSDAVGRALAKEREKRFPTMDDLLLALDNRRSGPSPEDTALSLAPTEELPVTPALGSARTPGPSRGSSGSNPPRTISGGALVGSPQSAEAPPVRRSKVALWVALLVVAAMAAAAPSALRRWLPATASIGSTRPSVVTTNPDEPLVGLCGPGLKSDCTAGTEAWCDERDHVVACCAQGLVAVGTDGVCDCPPGGEDPDAGRTSCAKGATSGVPGAAEVIASLQPVFKSCFDQALDGAAVEGRLTIEVRVAPDGRVFRARIREGRMASQAVQKCNLDAVRQAKFAPPSGGSAVLIVPLGSGPDRDEPSEDASVAAVDAGDGAPVDEARAAEAGDDAEAGGASREALFVPCGATRADILPVGKSGEPACTPGFKAWCAPSGKTVGCCAEGLVAEGADGVCACPPGGTEKGQAAPAGCAAQVSEFTTPSMQARVRSALPQLRACYEDALKRSPDATGTVKVYFEVAPHGDVFYVRVEESSLPDADAQRCMLKHFRALKFAAPSGGFAGVSYPIVFALE
jgi:hypothetical protein